MFDYCTEEKEDNTIRKKRNSQWREGIRGENDEHPQRERFFSNGKIQQKGGGEILKSSNLLTGTSEGRKSMGCAESQQKGSAV